ncbi:MAG: FHA domain-containing protein [Thermodesulfobacteriota bacterium]
MDKNGEKTTSYGDPQETSAGEDEFGYSTTVELSRKAFTGEISLSQRGSLEVVSPGEAAKLFELGEEEVVLGRSPECGIHLGVGNVSRRHARVFFRNDEYHLEDLESTNGTYVNGIKVAKCTLRNNDHIEIGGVKILFTEEKILKRT